ncbi:unnamed protein product [Cuscuta campestris]|uniref:Uncharacterized protein n=1 Tax=Cuscuta campestris TaxID=132261 RepID=A0A484NSR5_9ASTE|nr:unnamed protein product [Cuscuta campestris]
MALPSGFRERLEQMEETRNQRLLLLEAEKELQINKSRVFAARLSSVRSAEQRCLNLERKIVSQQLLISALKSEIDRVDSDHLRSLQKFRSTLKDCGDGER